MIDWSTIKIIFWFFFQSFQEKLEGVINHDAEFEEIVKHNFTVLTTYKEFL